MSGLSGFVTTSVVISEDGLDLQENRLTNVPGTFFFNIFQRNKDGITFLYVFMFFTLRLYVLILLSLAVDLNIRSETLAQQLDRRKVCR